MSGTTGDPPGWKENEGPTDMSGEVAPLSDGLLFDMLREASEADAEKQRSDDLESLNRLLLSLREISRREDDQRLSAAGNVRAKYIDTLRSTLNYLYPRTNLDLELYETFQHLLIALDDLQHGVIDPIFKVEGSNKRDPSYLWYARMKVVLALEWFHRCGMSYSEVSRQMAKQVPQLANLKRGEARELASSILSWRVLFMDSKVPHHALRRSFVEGYREVERQPPYNKEAVPPINYHQVYGRRLLREAAEMAARVIQPDE